MKIISEIHCCNGCQHFKMKWEVCKHPLIIQNRKGKKVPYDELIPEWCPEKILYKTTIVSRIPKDAILADYLEERGFVSLAEEIRNSLVT